MGLLALSPLEVVDSNSSGESPNKRRRRPRVLLLFSLAIFVVLWIAAVLGCTRNTREWENKS